MKSKIHTHTPHKFVHRRKYRHAGRYYKKKKENENNSAGYSWQFKCNRVVGPSRGPLGDGPFSRKIVFGRCSCIITQWCARKRYHDDSIRFYTYVTCRNKDMYETDAVTTWRADAGERIKKFTSLWFTMRHQHIYMYLYTYTGWCFYGSPVVGGRVIKSSWLGMKIVYC